MPCACYTKSIFTTQLIEAKHLFVSIPVIGANATTDLNIITPYYDFVDKVEKLYGEPMADRNYQRIPTNYAQFLELYNILVKLTTQTENPNLLLLLKLAVDALEGAINTTNLYGQTLALEVDKINLQKRVTDILSNKNEQVVEIPSLTQGQLAVTQTFTLAPVFNYYILIFGIPAYGVGFDPSKISFLADVLTNMGINPYK